MLSVDEKRYYQRQLIVPELAEKGQLKLKKSRVLVVGAGGLGCPVLTYLSAAGIGTIGIVDGDTVSESNLHRQVLFSIKDVGKNKAKVARAYLSDRNPYIKIKSYTEPLRPQNAVDIVKNYDVVVDATDNFPARYLINDACVILNKPFVLGSIDRLQGQVSVLNYYNSNGETGPTYRCLFPYPPTAEAAPNCAQNGVIGVLPGIIGLYQANEVLKIIAGYGSVLSGRLLIFDAASDATYEMAFKRNPQMAELAKNLEKHISGYDYEDFCHLKIPESCELSSAELADLLSEEPQTIQLIDVREEPEFGQLPGSVAIPLSVLAENARQIHTDKKAVLYCDHGISSVQATLILLGKGFKKIYNLTGGMAAWNKNQHD